MLRIRFIVKIGYIFFLIEKKLLDKYDNNNFCKNNIVFVNKIIILCWIKILIFYDYWNFFKFFVMILNWNIRKKNGWC